jgi:hypothetical protein
LFTLYSNPVVLLMVMLPVVCPQPGSTSVSMGAEGGVVTSISAAFPHLGLISSGFAKMAGHLFLSPPEASVHARNTLVSLMVDPQTKVIGTDSNPFIVLPGKPS